MTRGQRPKGAKAQALERPRHGDSVAAWIVRYLEHVRVLGLSEYSWRRVHDDLVRFNAWCEERAIERPSEISKPVLERYQRYLFYYRKADGGPLALQSQVRELMRIKHWFRWLVRHNYLPSNPASDLEMPHAPKRYLPHVLSHEEVERILAMPDVATPLGLRDRAMMEVLYSTGLRRMEVLNLTIWDVHFGRGSVFVRQGKGRKDRMVPIGERALAWLSRYVDEVRGGWLMDPKETALFLTHEGKQPVLEHLTGLVRRYIQRAGIDKPGSCHLFRHAAATAMLERGADIRFIQAMLGHANLETTQGYTHVSIEALKAVHAATHPGARLARKPKPGADADADPNGEAPAA